MMLSMIRAGTSGYNYDAWRGSFYPDDLPQSKMLRFYAGEFSTVEINYTFRRMPTKKAVESWAAQVGEDFRFALKAPFWVVNQKKASASLRALKPFLEVTSLLGARRGPILFQFPPNLKKDLPRLQSFLLALPADILAAFELQDPSWHEDDVFAALSAKAAALCITDDDEIRTPVQKTAPWSYLRLRRTHYDKRALGRWKKRIEETWDDAWVYFRHEDTGTGPQFARSLV
jgi:uncharacterized protein YecE (DUF72 family)